MLFTKPRNPPILESVVITTESLSVTAPSATGIVMFSQYDLSLLPHV